tara:strand:+ start:303 stop:491 length:189 start_codon:yes stop_codon:yes gene_type:complete
MATETIKAKVKTLTAIAVAQNELLNDLMRYVKSSKFNEDQMVNTADIILRLEEGQRVIAAIE